MEVIKLNSQNFQEEVLKADKKVLVDFYADWCGPCKMMSPIIDEIANEFSDKIKVCKINVDEAPDIAVEYGIVSIPTLIIFENGYAINTTVGLISRGELIDLIG